ncbi:MAG: diacylglycerol kinase family protein [Pseudomonadota bacterium]
MSTPTVVLINARAGSMHTTNSAAALSEKFQHAGIAATVTLFKNGTELIAAARAAVAEGVATVVAGGGDGTISAVASALVDSTCVLGILPLGTLNHFAKDLDLPLGLDEAIAIIAAGNVETVDTGEVNGHVFLNNSSLGLYPDIVRSRERQQRRLGRSKWPAFISASLMALRRYPFMTVRLAADGLCEPRETPFIFIGNNAYSMSGLTAGARASLQDGVLSLYVAQRTSRLGLLRLAFWALLGRLRQASDFDALQVRELRVETKRRRLPVAADGEVMWLQTPLCYRIRPRSLQVYVPVRSTDSST